MSLQAPPLRDMIIDPKALKGQATFGKEGVVTPPWENWFTLVLNAVNASASATTATSRAEGRLTLETGVPVSTTDQSAKATLYFTPYKGNQIGLYDGSSWVTRTFAELSLSLAGYTASKPYDIWCYDNAGAAALESTVWTNPTTRATALVLQDGVYVKTGTLTRRYLGTIYINAAGGVASDTALIRGVSNFYNRVPRQLAVHDSTASWAMGTSWQSTRGQASNAVSMMIGWADAWMELEARLIAALSQTATYGMATAIGEDVTNAPMAEGVMTGSVVGGAAGGPTTTGHAAHRVEKYPAVGYHTYNWLEWSSGGDTAYGAQTGAYWKARTGMIGSILA